MADDRAERLARQLRANLQRRKGQRRARGDAPPDERPNGPGSNGGADDARLTPPTPADRDPEA